MRQIVRSATMVLGLTLGVAAGRAENLAEPAAAPAVALPPSTRPGPLLGRTHLWLKAGRLDLDGAAASIWGVDHEGYLALEAYHGWSRDVYFGGEIGHARSGRSVTEDGETIRDLDLIWLEINEKKALDLGRGLTLDLGAGWSLFYVDGEEVSTLDGQEVADPLADIGFGLQVVVGLNWRVRRLLVGLDGRYQRAFDLIDINYSNLRFGVHIGLAF